MTITIGSAVASSASGLPRGVTCKSIGNSIMAAGHHLTGTTEPGYMNQSSILFWSILASGGKLCALAGATDDAAAATSNLSAKEVRDTHLSAITTDKPNVVIIGPLCTNGGPDYAPDGGVGIGKTVTRDIASQIQAYGGLPVFISELPSGGGSTNTNISRTWIAQHNAWLRRYAHSIGAVYVDAYGATVDPATDGKFLAAHSDDGLHPNIAGAKKIGETVAAALTPILNPVAGVPLAQAFEQNLLLTTNPLNTGGGAGVAPTGWTPNGTGTPSGDETAPFGKWFKIAATVDGYRATGPVITIPDGNRVLLAVRFRAAAIPSGGSAKIVLRPQGGGDKLGCSSSVACEGVYAAEMAWANSGGTQNMLWLTTSGVGTEASVAQVTLIDLTAKTVIPV